MTDRPNHGEPVSGMSEPTAGAHRIVVIGAGFGGLAVARALTGHDLHITLIDRTNHNLFQPLLYQVATAALSSNDIALPIRSVFRSRPEVLVLMAEVTGIDRIAKLVRIEGAPAVPYDTLVLATGSVYSWFGHDQWALRAPALKTVSDALSLRNRLLDVFERAELSTDPVETSRLLTFVVVGAGPTGVEMAGAIAELSRNTLDRDFRRIYPSHARIVLCDARDRVLATFPKQLSDYAARQLGKLGIELALNTGVEDIDARGVVAGGRRIDAECVFWAAGTKATPVASWLGVQPERNGLVRVEPDCSLPGHPDIFIIGDAALLDGGNGKPLPGLGSVAKQQGNYVGKLISARLGGGRQSAPFRYRNWAELAMIGGSSAVGNFGWIRVTGFPAWVMWSIIHLMLLVSVRNRTVVYVNWVWAWLTYGRGARVITRTPPQFSDGRP